MAMSREEAEKLLRQCCERSRAVWLKQRRGVDPESPLFRAAVHDYARVRDEFLTALCAEPDAESPDEWYKPDRDESGIILTKKVLLSRENRRLRKALQAVEWVSRVGSGGQYCPWCKGYYPEHVPDCARQAAITAADATDAAYPNTPQAD